MYNIGYKVIDNFIELLEAYKLYLKETNKNKNNANRIIELINFLIPQLKYFLENLIDRFSKKIKIIFKMFLLLTGCYINYLSSKLYNSHTGVYHILFNYYLIAVRQGIISAISTDDWNKEINLNIIDMMFDKFGYDKMGIAWKTAA